MEALLKAPGKVIWITEAVSTADLTDGNTIACKKGTDLCKNQIVFVFSDRFAGLLFEVRAHFRL